MKGRYFHRQTLLLLHTVQNNMAIVITIQPKSASCKAQLVKKGMYSMK